MIDPNREKKTSYRTSLERWRRLGERKNQTGEDIQEIIDAALDAYLGAPVVASPKLPAELSRLTEALHWLYRHGEKSLPYIYEVVIRGLRVVAREIRKEI